MKLKIFLITLLFLLGGKLSAQRQDSLVRVVIDYGTLRPSETHEVKWYEGLTAMSALQACATVESHPRAGYVFVWAINHLALEPGKWAWYYTLNGKRATRVALHQRLQPRDEVAWQYRTDVCTPKKEVER